MITHSSIFPHNENDIEQTYLYHTMDSEVQNFHFYSIALLDLLLYVKGKISHSEHSDHFTFFSPPTPPTMDNEVQNFHFYSIALLVLLLYVKEKIIHSEHLDHFYIFFSSYSPCSL